MKRLAVLLLLAVVALAAANEPGTLKWRYQTGDFVRSSPAIGSDGTVYVGSDDNYLYALTPSGQLKWRYQTGGVVHYSPAIGPDGTVYVGSFDDYLYALTPSGQLKWRYQTGSYVSSSPAIGPDGTMYVGFSDNYLYAISPDGTLKWRYQAGSAVFSSPAIGSDGTVYVGSCDRYLYALTPSGQLKWRYQTGHWVGSSPAIGSDGTVYVGSCDNYLYALTPSGQLKWRYQTGHWVGSPAIGSDGTVYVGSRDGYLYAIRSNSRGLANSPWPKFGHDNRNTGRGGGSVLVVGGERISVIPEQRPSKFPPTLTLRLGFNDLGKRQNNALDAGEQGEIKAMVHNEGPGKAVNCALYVGLSEPNPLLSFERRHPLDTLEAGDSTIIRIPISANDEVASRSVDFQGVVNEPYFGANSDTAVVVFSTRAIDPPDIVVAQTAIDDDRQGESHGNSNSKIDAPETVELVFRLQNKGPGEAENVQVSYTISDETNVVQLSDKRTFGLGNIAPGEWKDMVIPVYVNKNIPTQEFTVNLTIQERRPKFNSSHTVTIPLDKEITSTQVVVVHETETTPAQRPSGYDMPDLVADVDTLVPKTRESRPKGQAVVIGVRDYQNKDVPDVKYAVHDAAIVHEYLINTLGYEKDNIIWLVNPDKAEFEKVFGTREHPRGQLARRVTEGASDVFIYYSGHGAPDPNECRAYLMPANCDPSYAAQQGYSIDLLYDNLGKLNARTVTVVLDACFSGRSAGGNILANASPAVISTLESRANFPPGSAILSASKSDQIASWYTQKKHGLFTYFFLKGLAGDADTNGDKAITLGELKAYLTENVKGTADRLHGRIQEPTIEGEENVVIVRLK